MKRMMTGVGNLIAEEMTNQAEDAIDRQVTEQEKMIKQEVHDADFALEFDKSSFAIMGMIWMMGIIVSLKIFGRDLFFAYQEGTLFDISTYSTWKIGMLILVVGAVLFFSVFCIIFAWKPMPRIRGTNMYYRGNLIHYSEITKLVVKGRMNLTKVYLNGKYKFWISPDYINYRSFIEWAKKCNIRIEGDTTIRFVNVDSNRKKTYIIAVIIALVMIALAIAIPTIIAMKY